MPQVARPVERIYLDHNATTPPHPAVVEAMARALREGWGNASSIHAEGRAARNVVDEARDAVAAAVGVRTDQVTFTSGGTEADNLALLGTASAWRATHPAGGHVVMTAIEHPAVLRCGLALERDGIAVTRLAPAPDGRVALDRVTAAFRPDTFLVSVMAVNNETGVIQPFAEIGAACRARGILFHTDAVQGLAKIPLDLGRTPVDLCAISAHKIYGPKGVGALILRPGIALAARTHGGGQEDGRRTGTENVPGIAGFGAAARLVADGRLHDLVAIGRLREHLWDGIHAAVPDARRNGDPAHTIATTLSVTFPGLASDALQLRLDLDGLAVSTGSACASGAPEPSHVLLAQGLSKADARGTVRLSLGRDNTPAQVDRAIAAIGKSVDALRALARTQR